MITLKLKLLGLSRACNNNEHMLTADPDQSIFTDKELLSIDLELLEQLLKCGLAYCGEEEMQRLLTHAREPYK